jgi:hypothetical protein
LIVTEAKIYVVQMQRMYYLVWKTLKIERAITLSSRELNSGLVETIGRSQKFGDRADTDSY